MAVLSSPLPLKSPLWHFFFWEILAPLFWECVWERAISKALLCVPMDGGKEDAGWAPGLEVQQQSFVECPHSSPPRHSASPAGSQTSRGWICTTQDTFFSPRCFLSSLDPGESWKLASCLYPFPYLLPPALHTSGSSTQSPPPDKTHMVSYWSCNEQPQTCGFKLWKKKMYTFVVLEVRNPRC